MHDTHYRSRLILGSIVAAFFRIHDLPLILPLENALDHGELENVSIITSLL